MEHHFLSRQIFLCILIVIMPLLIYSQGAVQPLQQGELNRVLNNAFNKLVTSNSNVGTIANFASIDPINANFVLKSTIPIEPGRKKRLQGLSYEQKLGNDPGNISYLSLTASGDLIDNNYGGLFTNSSLNADVSLGLQYNFTIKTPHFSFFEEDWNEYLLNRDLLFAKYNSNRVTIEKSINDVALQRTKYLMNLQQVSNKNNLQSKQLQFNLLQKSIDSLGLAIKDHTTLIDTLQKLATDIASIQKDGDAISASLDSLSFVEHDLQGHKIIQLEVLRNKLKQDYDTLLSKVSLQKLNVSWISVSGSFAKKSFTTFDGTLPFNSQLNNNTLNTYNFGIFINYLFQDKLKHHLFYLNGGLAYLRDNNLNLLSPSIIQQTRTITNTAGDTTRQIFNKYNAYTGIVGNFNALEFSLHSYYIFGKTPSGFHVFPLIDFQNNKKIISTIAFGYLIAFQNTVKDQPVINTELYIKFKDIFNNNNIESKFYNRNEIGVSFTIPFKFLLN